MSSLVLLLFLAADDGSLEARARRANEEGMALAKANQLEAAIVRFKDAEQLLPRFEHQCNAGRAYALSKRWAQAWLFLDDCRVRGGKNVGPWVGTLVKQVEAELISLGHRPVALESEALVTVVLPTFAADERWRVLGSRTVWLPRERVELALTSEATSWTTAVPQNVERVVLKQPEPVETRPPELTVAPVEPPKPLVTAEVAPPRPSRWVGPLVLGGAGVVSLITSAFLFGVARASLDEANRLPAGVGFDAVSARYERERAGFYLLLGAGALAVVGGLVWWLLAPSAAESTPEAR